MKTQSQEYLEMAAGRVAGVEGKPWAKVYGGLCHSFPVLVRTCGLAQAVAFHQSKKQNPAHNRLLEDYEALLPAFDLGAAPLAEYMRATRRVLAAWLFYKRFAASILKATAADADESKEVGAHETSS